MNKPKFTAKLLMPHHWPVWLLMGILAAITFLPYKLQLSIGKGLGLLAHKLVGRRRHVAEVNIALCFPEKSAEEQAALVRQTFIDNGIGFFETLISWFRPADYLLPITHFTGLDKIAAAQAEGKGVILLGAHYSMLDLSGALICNHIEPTILTNLRTNPV